LDRRQKAGLTLTGLWLVIVIVIALVTHRLVARGCSESIRRWLSRFATARTPAVEASGTITLR
jgi:peptidoglycan/LPS O-acetylase OafA/YrhL